MIYQAEPNPQAFKNTIGNPVFGAKIGPIVGQMVRGIDVLRLSFACRYSALYADLD